MFALIDNGLYGQRDWSPAWRDPAQGALYDPIIGGDIHDDRVTVR